MEGQKDEDICKKRKMAEKNRDMKVKGKRKMLISKVTIPSEEIALTIFDFRLGVDFIKLGAERKA